MFHVYITTSKGRQVDAGRAQFLMDKEICRDLAQLGLDDQKFWERYCIAHAERFGEPFRPDVDETWS